MTGYAKGRKLAVKSFCKKATIKSWILISTFTPLKHLMGDRNDSGDMRNEFISMDDRVCRLRDVRSAIPAPPFIPLGHCSQARSSSLPWGCADFLSFSTFDVRIPICALQLDDSRAACFLIEGFKRWLKFSPEYLCICHLKRWLPFM